MHCPLRGQSITPIGGNASKTKFLIDCLLRRQCIARIFCFGGNALYLKYLLYPFFWSPEVDDTLKILFLVLRIFYLSKQLFIKLI